MNFFLDFEYCGTVWAKWTDIYQIEFQDRKRNGYIICSMYDIFDIFYIQKFNPNFQLFMWTIFSKFVYSANYVKTMF